MWLLRRRSGARCGRGGLAREEGTALSRSLVWSSARRGRAVVSLSLVVALAAAHERTKRGEIEAKPEQRERGRGAS